MAPKAIHADLSWAIAPPNTLLATLLAALIVALPLAAEAQPSGGPYGPQDRDYPVPETGTVLYVAPDGRDDASGERLEAPTTLASAIARVVTGDTIVLRGGEYRTGGLLLNQGVTLQPYGRERPVLKGTRLATEWEMLRDGVWRTSWDTLFPTEPMGWWRREREGMRTPMHRFDNDMVFLDGEPLVSVGWEGELDAHSYYIDHEQGHVYLGADPTGRNVEITAFDGAIIRTSREVHGKRNDGKGPVIRGLKITQYAYRCLEVEGKRQITMHEEPTDEPVGLADPSTFGKEITGTVLENLEISYCSRVAGYFRGDGLVIRNSLVSDTGTEGIYVIGSSDVLIERNIIRRNNIEGLTGYYASAVKIFNQTRRVTFRDNLVIDHPESNGVWYDVGNREGVIVNNRIENTQDGIFFEISDGVVIAGNLLVNNDKGLRVLNSANVQAWHNTFVNSRASFERDRRGDGSDHFGWHVTTGPGVDEREGHVFAGNLLVADAGHGQPLLQFQQPPEMCERLSRPMAERVDGNRYVRPGLSTGDAPPLARISPAANEGCVLEPANLDALRDALGGGESSGDALDRTPRSILLGPDAGHYEPQAGLSAAPPSPAAVREALGWKDEGANPPGAWPYPAAD